MYEHVLTQDVESVGAKPQTKKKAYFESYLENHDPDLESSPIIRKQQKPANIKDDIIFPQEIKSA